MRNHAPATRWLPARARGSQTAAGKLGVNAVELSLQVLAVGLLLADDGLDPIVEDPQASVSVCGAGQRGECEAEGDSGHDEAIP